MGYGLRGLWGRNSQPGIRKGYVVVPAMDPSIQYEHSGAGRWSSTTSDIKVLPPEQLFFGWSVSAEEISQEAVFVLRDVECRIV